MLLPEIELLGRLGEGAKVGDEVPGVEDDLCRQHAQVEAIEQPTVVGVVRAQGQGDG